MLAKPARALLLGQLTALETDPNVAAALRSAVSFPTFLLTLARLGAEPAVLNRIVSGYGQISVYEMPSSLRAEILYEVLDLLDAFCRYQESSLDSVKCLTLA